MVPKGTIRVRCWRCKKLTLVPNPTPCEEETRLYFNGVWLSTMNEYCEQKTLGALCFECAFIASWNGDEYDLSLGFSGDLIQNLDLWDALITRHKEAKQ